MRKIFAGTNPEISEREVRNSKLAREIAEEGIVVLKNDDVLPVNAEKIALFGSGARRTVKGGTGSGSVNERHSVSIEEGLIKAGFSVTTTGWLDRYDEYYDNTYKAWKDAREAEVVGISDIIQILGIVGKTAFVYPTGIPIEESDILAADTDTAIYVLARQAGEGSDRTNEEGDFLPAPVEYENIRLLTQRFEKTIVVINAGGQIDTSEIEKLGVQALIFYGQAGQEGGLALADILSGRVNPSGKLTFSWARSYSDIPCGAAYGAMGNPKEQDYLEDIFVGYRYYDTFGKEPAYPFGFGLSYTKFSINAAAKLDGEVVIVSGEVENIGEREGKEVVQVYATVPFGRDGAEYQRLVGFYKTPLLKAGEKCTFEERFQVRELARYDEEHAAYMLTEGSYLIRVGNSSRNTVIVAEAVLDREVVVEECINICPVQKELALLKAPMRKEETVKAEKINIDASAICCKKHDYSLMEESASAEDNELLDKMPLSDLAKLVIGGGFMGDKVVTVFGSSGSTSSDLYEKYGIPNIAMLDGPVGLNVANKFTVDEKGEIMTLSIPPAYDFGVYSQHLRQMIDAAAEDGETRYQYATAWPCSTLLAQSWNRPLAERYGEGVGEELKELGGSVWLAPGMNIHRNPLCGRNFEYYSEDPFVTGHIAASVVKGAQKSGRAVSIKHFCCNNVECERSWSSSNLSERALREIYLKGFRIAVEGAAPMTVMSSYNLVNGVYNCNNPDLLVKVLRNEWGFDGIVMTDWQACGDTKGDTITAIKAQNDLIMPGSPEQEAEIVHAVEEGTLSMDELCLCAARNLKLIRKTSAIEIETR